MKLDAPLNLDFEINTITRLSGRERSVYVRNLMALINTIAERLVEEKKLLELDGVKVFEQNDLFLPGKIMIALSFWVTQYPADSTITVERCSTFRELVNMLLDDPCETWGAHFYLKALTRLNDAGLMDACISAEAISKLRSRLDWRLFVDELTYDLKGKPHNFYGVAYSIASSRFLLGWDDDSHSDAILGRLLEHYQVQRGEHGFPDETDGKGRYDRYSFLLMAEMAAYYQNASKSLTQEMELALRKSAEYVLFNINYEGEGFQFGRSIGAYGDSAFLQILGAAAFHGLLTKFELQDGFLLSRLITDRFLNFWFDKARGAVNLWEDGRETESYRGKSRILGETLSLAVQHLETHIQWEALLMEGSSPITPNQNTFVRSLEEVNEHRVTWFHSSTYEYALISVRRGLHLFNVPLVNADKFYRSMAYSPAPFSGRLIQAAPTESSLQLTPVVELVNGSELAPVAWYRGIQVQEGSATTVASWYVDEMSLMGASSRPEKYTGMKVETVLTVHRDCVERHDKISFTDALQVRRVYLEYLSPFDLEYDDTENLFVSRNSKLKLELLGFDNALAKSAAGLGSVKEEFRTRIAAQKMIGNGAEAVSVSWKLYF